MRMRKRGKISRQLRSLKSESYGFTVMLAMINVQTDAPNVMIYGVLMTQIARNINFAPRPREILLVNYDCEFVTIIII